jgi:hypothetical protein
VSQKDICLKLNEDNTAVETFRDIEVSIGRMSDYSWAELFFPSSVSIGSSKEFLIRVCDSHPSS